MVKRVRLSRRTLLKWIGAGLLTGCVPQLTEPAGVEPETAAPTETRVAATGTPPPATAQPPATPTVVAMPSPTGPADQPTAAPTPQPATPTPAPMPLPVAGSVARVRHPAVWQGPDLDPAALQAMLDAGMAALMGTADADAAWAALFAPSERVAIKVNTIRGSGYWTHVPLVMGIVAGLQRAGLAPEQIVIYDRQTRELEEAGFAVNRDGPGARCYGTDGAYTRDWSLLGDQIGISDVLLSCDALINVPLLKAHGTSGMSFAMKNHYGTFDQPARYHRPRIDQALGELSALPPIADRTRLIIGDTLSICTRGWYDAVTGDTLLLSRDPVAHDAVGVEVLAQAIAAEGGTSTIQERTAPWLAHAASLGLGVAAREQIELVELDLGG